MLEWFNWATPSYYIFSYISTLLNFKSEKSYWVSWLQGIIIRSHLVSVLLLPFTVLYILMEHCYCLHLNYILWRHLPSQMRDPSHVKQLDPVIEILHINSTCHLVLLGTSAVKLKSLSNSLKHNVKWCLIHFQILKPFPVCSGKWKGK